MIHTHRNYVTRSRRRGMSLVEVLISTAITSMLLTASGAAYKASKRDEEGYAPLSELGQRAKAVSSFAARNYGYTRLSDLIKAVPNFEVKSGDDGRLLVKRLR